MVILNQMDYMICHHDVPNMEILVTETEHQLEYDFNFYGW
jgi:hypothetical protein